MKDLVLLKIGGSICTEKSTGKFRVKTKVVGRIAAEIMEARKRKEFRLLVVNGAGPFGHANVAEYDINDGLRTDRDFEGFIKTVSDCGHLNSEVSRIMRKNGLLAHPYPTSSVMIQSKKRIVFFCTDVIKRLWDSNDRIVPVMNGTMVPDTELKGSVVGGDEVIEHLAGRLLARKIIFATDVDGIFTRDPRKYKSAKLIDVVTKGNFEQLKKGITGSSAVDVTGGMLGKVERLLSLDVPAMIINGNVPGRVRDALLGKAVKGSNIKP